MEQSEITAIILAAGYSERMGSFKPLLDLGGQPVIARVAASFVKAGIRDVRVVVGYCKDLLLPVLEELGVRTIINENYDAGMFSSVLAALKSPGMGGKAFFLLPADIPLVRPRTIRYLAENLGHNSGKILKPCFMDRQGHPPLIPAGFIKSIMNYKGDDGLKGALAQLAGETLSIAVPDENILFDLDSPADYAELLERWKRHNMPSVRECEAIMKTIYSTEERTVRHCAVVADVAGKITDDLNRSGCTLDRDLIQAAALLHDMAKGKPQHANESARRVRELGYPDVACIIESHMDIGVSAGDGVSAAGVLYLADKLVKDATLIPLAERFDGALARHRHDPVIVRAIETRYKNACVIRDCVEARTGRLVLDLS